MKNLFYLQKNDRLVIIALLVLLVVVSVVMYVSLPSPDSYAEYQGSKKTELFYFDPNTADSIQFARLGILPRQIHNIYKYRAKGGRFRKPSDFSRIYGLSKEKYDELEPYIKIQKYR
ncbi:MAG: helix-hairpin-helix domain-containing protein [Prevotella sp.]|nr:helix-hairpin-helix domain-containing protein [Prevotella sp.]